MAWLKSAEESKALCSDAAGEWVHFTGMRFMAVSFAWRLSVGRSEEGRADEVLLFPCEGRLYH